MPIDDDPFEPDQDEYSDYVTAVVARNDDAAERFRELLADHDIPSTVGEEDDDGAATMTRGMPVMVPEPLLDEASEIIAEYEDTEQFETDEEEFEDEEEEDEDLFTEKEGFEEFEEEEDLFDDDEEDDEDLFGVDEEEDEDLLDDEDEPF